MKKNQTNEREAAAAEPHSTTQRLSLSLALSRYTFNSVQLGVFAVIVVVIVVMMVMVVIIIQYC